MGFLDRQPFDGTDPDGRALLAALRAVYDQAPAVRELVLAAGMRPADFPWTAPMSQVWPEVLRRAAASGRLRDLVATVAEDQGTTAYEVIARLVTESAEEATTQAPGGQELIEDAEHGSDAPAADPRPVRPDEQPGRAGRREQSEHLPARLPSAEDVRGLDDDQVRVLRSCAAALKDFMTAADTAERISRFSPEFADISATMQFELSRAKRELLALKQSVGLTNWPDAGLAAKLITARNRAQRDVEAAQRRPGVPEGTSQSHQRFRQSAAALQALLREHYPSLFTASP